jgi:Carboxypeptidase regulatory-like domain
MTVLLAILISGVLLDSNDRAMPNYHLVFTSADGKLFIEAMTDKEGKFRVFLAPGTYRFQIAQNGYYPELEKADKITVDENTSTLKLKLHQPQQAQPPEPHVIEVVPGIQRLYSPLGPRA